MAKEAKEKVVKTAEQLKAEAIERDTIRYDKVVSMLQIGSIIKGELTDEGSQKFKFFKNISGDKGFQLTQSQWKNVEASKAFKQPFLDEVRKYFNLTRTSGSIVRVGGTGQGRLANGANIKRVTSQTAVGEGGAINQALVDAGVKVGDAVDALRSTLEAELKLMVENGLELKQYIRRIVEKEETAPATA